MCSKQCSSCGGGASLSESPLPEEMPPPAAEEPPVVATPCLKESGGRSLPPVAANKVIIQSTLNSIYTHISVVITRERWRDSTIHEIRHLFCHATTTGHRVRFVDGLPGASLPPEPDALHKSLTFYLLVFCSSDAVAV